MPLPSSLPYTLRSVCEALRADVGWPSRAVTLFIKWDGPARAAVDGCSGRDRRIRGQACRGLDLVSNEKRDVAFRIPCQAVSKSSVL